MRTGMRSGARKVREQVFGNAKHKVRVIVLGGVEEVGRNCTMIEYGNDIIFIDMGLQFPEEGMHGIDYIIPNMDCTKGKEKNVRGVIITHGHYDHIGGIPHIIPEIGNPPIYGLPLTNAIIKKRQDDFGRKKLNLNQISLDDKITLGKFKVEFFHVNHNIPDSMGIVVHTPAGTIVHTGDWKFDYQPVDGKPADLARLAEIGNNGVLALMSDSTNAPNDGHQISEHVVGKNLEDLIMKMEGRLIIGTFASLLSRVQQILELAAKHGKKVAIQGYSMKSNVEIMKELKYMTVPKSTIIGIDQIDDYPTDQVIIMGTGAQGERNAVISRIAHDEHQYVKLMKGDTVIFSSSVIPGNEASVQKLKDIIFRKGAKVIHYKMMDIHAGGHAQAEDIKLMLRLIRPQYFIPIEGNHFLLHYNANIAKAMMVPEKNIFIPDNGQVMLFTEKGAALTKEKVNTDYVFVDGLGVGDVSHVVLRDRQALADDGMIVVIATVIAKTGKLAQNPDIISRGFVFLKENKGLIEEMRKRARKLVESSDPQSWADTDHIRNSLRNELGDYIYHKTRRRPMVLPVVIQV